ncbi:hypothetical protein J2TS6_50090 [Paenibacillus albilobatus]|uniref:Uncharacterized protein n=2 Tax=Paenibacillus TaxID=44249 RepID=A0A920CDJ0_9BACL|nr:hypothetical protein [Paenibacillus albilobatus]GIO33868.1 hypothetical protein J2TS6_50090 [Paenibacillus albilobatus]
MVAEAEDDIDLRREPGNIEAWEKDQKQVCFWEKLSGLQRAEFWKGCGQKNMALDDTDR